MGALVPLWRAARIALAALAAYRLRSIFVIAAVSLGIASLTIIVAAVEGASRKADELTDMFGPDAVMVIGGNIYQRAVGQRSRTLTFDDAARVRASLPGVYLVVPQGWRGNVRLKYGAVNYDLPALEGATANYAEAWNWPLSQGRDLSEADVSQGGRVGIIGDETARTLFKDDSPIGKVILLNNFPITVIGVLQYRGLAGGGSSMDDRLIIPYTTMIQRFNMNRRYANMLRIKFSDINQIDAGIADLISLLRDQHRLAPDQPDDFTVISAKEIQQFLTMLKGGLVLFLGVTAAAAMVVGGFVLANLFYLSVQERRTEIGLRKAMGANNRAILRQFLFEAVGLTLLGAGGGIVLGAVGGQIFSTLGLIEMALSWRVFIFALAAALLVGIVFGLRPARQAAALDPIQALRGGQ